MNILNNSPRNTLFQGNGCKSLVNISVGLGIVSCKAQKTLRASIESHYASGLLNLFDRVHVCYQDAEFGDAVSIKHPEAKEHGEIKSTGVMDGMIKTARKLYTDYILFLGPDIHSIADEETMRKELREAVLKMRTESRLDRKVQCYLAGYKLVERMQGKGEEVFFDHPRPIKLPNQPLYFKDGSHWSVHPCVVSWTNIGAFVPREWFLDTLIPAVEAEKKEYQTFTEGHLDIEQTLQNGEWWYEQEWRVGMLDAELFQCHNEGDIEKHTFTGRSDVYQQYQPFREKGECCCG